VKASIDRTNCISCELCVQTCPEVFRMADDGLAEVYVDPVPAESEEKAKKAEADCPASVITIE
jgi:ferredoxin